MSWKCEFRRVVSFLMNGFSVGEFPLSGLGYVDLFVWLMVVYRRKPSPASLGVFVGQADCSSPCAATVYLCLTCYLQKGHGIGLSVQGQILNISGLVGYVKSMREGARGCANEQPYCDI